VDAANDMKVTLDNSSGSKVFVGITNDSNSGLRGTNSTVLKCVECGKKLQNTASEQCHKCANRSF
jgi:hypothetical protein